MRFDIDHEELEEYSRRAFFVKLKKSYIMPEEETYVTVGRRLTSYFVGYE